mmetsp:Transcript_50521/g.122001  ORF Transcript_50521/g.122001 Transcript_50521/m.122001 type:complete len:89 (+) Transcript_50521:67-333(+)
MEGKQNWKTSSEQKEQGPDEPDGSSRIVRNEVEEPLPPIGTLKKQTLLLRADGVWPRLLHVVVVVAPSSFAAVCDGGGGDDEDAVALC